MLRPLLLILVLMTLAPPALAQKTKAQPAPRTFVEALDKSTPERAAMAFLDAYAASDYLSAYYVMSWQARHGFGTQVGSFDLSGVFPGISGSSIPGSITWGPEGLSDLGVDMMSDIALVFDDVMFAAERNGILPFLLANPTVGAVQRVEGSNAILTVSNIGGRPAELQLGMVVLSDGSWRVDRIMWAGSDETKRPWGLPED